MGGFVHNNGLSRGEAAPEMMYECSARNITGPFAIMQHKPEAPAKILRWRFRLVLLIRARFRRRRVARPERACLNPRPFRACHPDLILDGSAHRHQTVSR